MKILIFSTNFLPHIGGAELATKEIISRLKNDGFDFTMITARHSPKLPQKEVLDGILVYRMGFGYSFLDKLILALWGARLGRKLHGQNRFESIHAVQASFGGIAAYFFKKSLPHVPFVLNIQEGKELDKQRAHIRFWRDGIIRSADKIIVISEYLKDYVREMGIVSEKIHLIPNGVDLNKFGRDFSYGDLGGLRDELGIKPGEKVVITSSRLEKKNNVEAVIDAVKKIENKNTRLLLIGSGSLENYLKARTKALEMDDRVIFTGAVKHEELPKYLAISNVFVRPSISEGLGTAFLEAMAAGVPIIGTNVGGIPDLLKDFETGLFSSTNAEDVAKKINLILEDEELRKRLNENGKRLI